MANSFLQHFVVMETMKSMPFSPRSFNYQTVIWFTKWILFPSFPASCRDLTIPIAVDVRGNRGANRHMPTIALSPCIHIRKEGIKGYLLPSFQVLAGSRLVHRACSGRWWQLCLRFAYPLAGLPFSTVVSCLLLNIILLFTGTKKGHSKWPFSDSCSY
jgi:hypothetical protein